MQEELELPTQEIGREFYGYKKEDVDRLLVGLYRDLRALKEENDRLEAGLSEARMKMACYGDLSEILTKTLENAEATASQIVAQAREEAGTIVAKAGREASELLEAAEFDRTAITNGYARLQEIEKELGEKIKSVLDTYLRLINTIKPEFIESTLASASGPATPAIKDLSEPPTKPQAKKPAERPVLARRAAGAVSPSLADQPIGMLLANLASSEAIKTGWVFASDGTVIAPIGSDRNLHRISSSLLDLDICFDGPETDRSCWQTQRSVTQLSNDLLVVSKLNEHTMLGVICSSEAPIDALLGTIDQHAEELRELLRQG